MKEKVSCYITKSIYHLRETAKGRVHRSQFHKIIILRDDSSIVFLEVDISLKYEQKYWGKKSIIIMPRTSGYPILPSIGGTTGGDSPFFFMTKPSVGLGKYGLHGMKESQDSKYKRH